MAVFWGLFLKNWLQNFTLAHCQPRSRGDGCAASGVCLTRSERFGHGQLLTHGILQMVKFKQDLSRPWHPQKDGLVFPALTFSHLPDIPRRTTTASSGFTSKTERWNHADSLKLIFKIDEIYIYLQTRMYTKKNATQQSSIHFEWYSAYKLRFKLITS